MNRSRISHYLAIVATAATIVAVMARPIAAQVSVNGNAASAIDDVLLLRLFGVLSNDSMQGRRIASPGGLRARGALLSELVRLSVAPMVPGYVQTFSAVPSVALNVEPAEFGFGSRPLLGQSTGTRRGPASAVIGTNVLGVVKGTAHPERYIVVSAHYDHIGIYAGQLMPGATDNASGAAALMAIADLLVLAPPKNSVILAWFDGEEYGRLGSRAFLDRPPVPIKQIVANVNLDMLSRSDEGGLTVVGEGPYPAIRPVLDSIALTGLVKMKPGHDGRDVAEDYYRRSDQWSFHSRDIPAWLLTSGDFIDLHLKTDTAERANVAFFVRATAGAAEFVRRLDEMYDDLFPKRR